MKIKNETINIDVAIYKCDNIGTNKVEILKESMNIKKLWLNQKGEEEKNLLELTDYIFGKSDENPFQSLNDEVQEKYNMYEERILDFVKKVKSSKIKTKINT